MNGKYVFYLAVVPVYRQQCVAHLVDQSQGDVLIFAGDAHLDATVTTGVGDKYVTRIRNRGVLGNRVLIQSGHLKDAIQAEVCVVDLNPRSLTAWLIAFSRRLLGRRTLVWGHLHPRAGAGARSAPIRRMLRQVAAGTIVYGYDSVVPARKELPDSPVWVAPNALYRASDMTSHGTNRDRIIYVGRLEKSKNVQILVDGFHQSELWRNGFKLDVVGSGSQKSAMERRAAELGASDYINFVGRIDDVSELRRLYARSLFSVSPGYVGLSLTQSLGFGVPMLYSEDERHAPEIELARFGGVCGFSPATVEELSGSMISYASLLAENAVDRVSLSDITRRYYSAEGMADGLMKALRNESMDLGHDGWPTHRAGIK